ncbi:MAG: ADP-forming succinate--CoA ligase subunit beta [Desulfurococcales archaeon]|nr:ADP-forming succinate--CoA ligase subunit beta [Desulfurococcales archaeon]
MKLYEYEAKEIARKYGIPVPPSIVASSPEDVYRAAEEIGGPCVIKAQVLVGRRGLSGGILFADSPEQAKSVAKKLLGTKIRGDVVKSVLVEKKVCIKRELYLALTVDRGLRRPILLASSMGGVEIEELVKKYPSALIKIPIDPFYGITPYMSRVIAVKLGIEKKLWKSLWKIIDASWRIMVEHDMELVEFNPLATTCEGELVALDAKMIIDDNSIIKHPEFKDRAFREYSRYELLAKKHGFSYVELDGDIGIMCNGAGLTMATMDVVRLYGGDPANFLDIGGGARRERVKEAAKILLEHPKTRVLLVNIFGGITRCDEVAMGLVEALKETSSRKPVIVRLLGTNEEEGKRILSNIGIPMYTELDDAVKKAIELAKR